MKFIIASIISCLLVVPAFSQEQAKPKNLIGFLKPQMHIGIVTFENSDRVRIEIYTEEDQKILMEASTMPLEQLSTKYQRVAEEIARVRKESLAYNADNRKLLTPGKIFGDVQFYMNPNARETFYLITAVGDDYILLSAMNKPSKKRAMSIHYVSSVNWNEELPIYGHSTIIDGK